MQYDEKGDNMLYIADKLGELNFRQLMDVYEEGNLENAAKFYPREPQNQWLLLAEQAFHQYLRECFFPTKGARYCLWIVDGRYFSALRLEPYRDGLLLEALETHPAERRKGYAAALVNAVLTKYPDEKIYSHVGKKNTASIKTHESCGFQRTAEHAVYIDGSVHSNSCTLCYEKTAR